MTPYERIAQILIASCLAAFLALLVMSVMKVLP